MLIDSIVARPQGGARVDARFKELLSHSCTCTGRKPPRETPTAWSVTRFKDQAHLNPTL